MTGIQGQGAPTPGWYADPTGQAGVRWWDGAQWTPHTAPLPADGPQQAAAGPRPRLPESAPVYNPFIWIIVLLPLVSAAAILLLPTFQYVTVGGVLRLDAASILTPGYAAAVVIDVLVIAAYLVLAALDRRALARAGVVRPFPWAWALFSLVNPLGCLVYPIGRSVIAHQVARPRGLVPIWVMIGTVIVNVVVQIVWVVALLSSLLSQLPSAS